MAKIRVYLDNCAYNRPFDNQEQIKIFLETEAKKHIQRLVVEETIELVYSYINRLENDDNPFAIRKNSINDFFKKSIFYVGSNHAKEIEEKAIGIMETGIKPRDALHIACAKKGNCAYFITTDKPLLKHTISGIIVCDPIQFIDYYEEEKNV